MYEIAEQPLRDLAPLSTPSQGLAMGHEVCTWKAARGSHVFIILNFSQINTMDQTSSIQNTSLDAFPP